MAIGIREIEALCSQLKAARSNYSVLEKDLIKLVCKLSKRLAWQECIGNTRAKPWSRYYKLIDAALSKQNNRSCSEDEK